MKVCVSVAEKDVPSAVDACISAKEKGADLIEVRFDHMADLPRSISGFGQVGVPMVATLRSAAEGGGYSGPDEEKAQFLIDAVGKGFSYVDIEMGFALIPKVLKAVGDGKMIISYHDFERTPKTSDIVHILVSCSGKGGIAKVALQINRPKDVLALIDASRAYAETGNEFVAIGMGEKGAVTRVLFERFGASFTYASMGAGREVSPGQISIAEMKRLTGDVIITGVTGQSLSHSLSAWMHDAAYVDERIPGKYLKFQAEREDLPDLLEMIAELGIRGTNVTIPHKQSIMQLLDQLDPDAERIGAVNTVKNEGGSLKGYNTDVHGVRMTFEKAGFDPKGRPVLVVGAGGAARAVSAYLSSLKADIYLANRTPDKAKALADSFDGIEVIDLKDMAKRQYDAVVNCTPLGMKGYPDELSVPEEVIRPGQFIMDTIYNPPRTRLVIEGGSRGANAVSGKDMLIFQAMKAFEIWTGVLPKYEVMRAGFEEGMSG
ncbi:MAG: shikimate dehydrogenase [Methanomassiliicoccales archaeon]|jgi:shikimate dehydrogenase/3-dehydroquinate dehydratase type I